MRHPTSMITVDSNGQRIETSPWAPGAAVAAAAMAMRLRIEHRHSHEQFCELWIDGRMRAYCANAGTALVLGAAAIGIDAATLNAINQGMT